MPYLSELQGRGTRDCGALGPAQIGPAQTDRATLHRVSLVKKALLFYKLMAHVDPREDELCY